MAPAALMWQMQNNVKIVEDNVYITNTHISPEEYRLTSIYEWEWGHTCSCGFLGPLKSSEGSLISYSLTY